MQNCRPGTRSAGTSKWIVREVQLARELGRPYLLFMADGVKVEPTLLAAAIGARAFPLTTTADDVGLSKVLALFEEEYSASPSMAYAFFATSLRQEAPEVSRAAHVVEQVTSMPCLLGQRLQGQHAQQEIVERIRNAQFVLADVTANNWNSIIEAGIARGAGTRLHLICKALESDELRTRFMFRDLEVNWYGNQLERLAAVHRIARLYRRRVFHPAVN